MKILNLYAGIGGNAKAFKETDEVVAVEYDPKIAEIYKDHFPSHTVIVGDAVEYLKENFQKFDFIWASPPCPSHSRIRKNSGKRTRLEDGTLHYHQNKPILPDMTLYAVIIFLDNYFEGDYIVENVKPYYEPLIEPFEIGRHYFWSSLDLSGLIYNRVSNIATSDIFDLSRYHGYNLIKYDGVNKKTILRNCVDKELAEIVMGRLKE